MWQGWSLLPDGIWDALGPFPSAFLCLVMSVLGHGLPITKMASPLSLLFSIKMHFGDLNFGNLQLGVLTGFFQRHGGNSLPSPTHPPTL